MDKIWYRNPSKSEVIGRCGGNEKTEWPRRTDKCRTLKEKGVKNNKMKSRASKSINNDCLMIITCKETLGIRCPSLLIPNSQIKWMTVSVQMFDCRCCLIYKRSYNQDQPGNSSICLLNPQTCHCSVCLLTLTFKTVLWNPLARF